MGLVSLLFGFKGRINRLQYWLGSLGVGVGGVFLIFFLAFLTAPPQINGKSEVGVLQMLAQLGLIVGPVWLLMGWAGLAIQVKRFHDRGRTGLWTLLPLLPAALLVVNMVGMIATNAPPQAVAAAVQPYMMMLWLINLGFFIDLGCLGSKPGPNKYGDPPGAPRSAAPLAPGPDVSRTTPATSSLFGAQTAMERAIAEKARQPQQQHAPAQSVATQPAAAFSHAPQPASFGRRVVPR